MWILKAKRRLEELGILGINRRNATCILDRNPRRLFPVVDNKIKMLQLCRRIGVPSPRVYAALVSNAQLRDLDSTLRPFSDFVIKPTCGSAGRGIMVIVGRVGEDFLRHNGDRVPVDDVRQHLSDILSGMYSLGGHPDSAILQQRIILHPDFERVSYKGIPDIRVIAYRNEPAMAMLRLPTRESNGRANLHQGGIGVGVDLATGVTHHAVQRNRMIERHPDTRAPLIGLRVPFWSEVLDMTRRVAAAVGLGYLGVDIVVDASFGPMLLEGNARPGLAIQIANAAGILPRLAAIDRMKSHETEKSNPEVREPHRQVA